jgi:3'(2'), 5'-bisphosphate nucleotidase
MSTASDLPREFPRLERFAEADATCLACRADTSRMHPNATDLATLRTLAETAVEAASRATRAVHDLPGDVSALLKDDRSPVTIADFAAQAVVAMTLARASGSPPRLVGEEHPAALEGETGRPMLEAVTAAVRVVFPEASTEDVLEAVGHGTAEPCDEGFWTLDPVDGTKGFLRRQQYAVALAWIEHGAPLVGALGCPHLPPNSQGDVEHADATGCIASAARGAGATLRAIGTPVESARSIHAVVWSAGDGIVCCESVESGHSKQDRTAAVLAACGSAAAPVRLDSQCKYAVVARGQAHAYLRLPTKAGYVERIWDHAAGSLVATEAGALVTDIDGKPLDFSHGRGLETNRGIVAASAALHPRLIEAIARS